MKTKTHILLAAIAIVPALALAGDISGTNTVTGFLSSANGNQNTVTGPASFATGQLSFVPGAVAFVAGQQNFVQGNWNAVFGYNNTAGPAGSFNIIGGTGNTATASRSLIIGNNARDNGRNGSVILTDSNPFGIRTNALPLQSPANDSFTTAFNGGYRMRTTHGQGANPNAGLFVLASGTQSSTVSQPAFVGINTATPGVALDVVGSTALNPPFSSVTNSSTSSYFSPEGGLITGYTGGFGNVSIRASGFVVASLFGAVSDERIKNPQGRSDRAEDLRTLLGIEITDYLYKDVVGKGGRPQKKVIAQQVEKVFPQAVSKTTDVVPDIYKKAAIDIDWVELGTDLKPGDRVRLITEDGAQAVHEVLEIAQGKFRTDLRSENKQVFVYGREVKDFRVVDYEAISMLNVSATQELARKAEARDAEVTKLRAENATLAQKLAALEARDQAREARLARLEAADKDRPARAVPAVLDLKASNR